MFLKPLYYHVDTHILLLRHDHAAILLTSAAAAQRDL